MAGLGISSIWAAGLLVTLSAVGCSRQASSGAYEDRSTPVNYVICGTGYVDCFLAARFPDMRQCEQHKKLSGMLCDSISYPGKVICTEASASVAVAYCDA